MSTESEAAEEKAECDAANGKRDEHVGGIAIVE